MKISLLLTKFFIFFLWAGVASGQSPEEVFRLAGQFREKVGVTERDRARYFLGLGLSELKNLRNQQKNGIELDGDSKQRLLLLEGSLAPIEEAFNRIRTSKDRVEAKMKLEQLSHDAEHANRVFSILGPTKALELTTERTIRALKNKAKTTAKNAFSPTTLITNKWMSKYLALTEEQERELNELVANTTDRIRYGSDGHLEKLRVILDAHWKSLLKALNDSQRLMARELIGQPIQWFRSKDKQTLRARDFLVKRGPLVNPVRLPLAGKTSKEIRHEIEKMDREFMHSHVYEMITSPFIWDELDLAPEQRNEIKSKENFKNIVAIPSLSQDRISQLLKQKEVTYCQSISNILTKDQLKLLRMMELQILTGKYELSVGLLHPSISNHLKLSSSKRERIRVLANKYQIDSELFAKGLAEDRKQSQEKFDESVSGILTEKQKKLLSKLTNQNEIKR